MSTKADTVLAEGAFGRVTRRLSGEIAVQLGELRFLVDVDGLNAISAMLEEAVHGIDSDGSDAMVLADEGWH